MRKEIPYLSEKELEQLIFQVEEQELVTAPPDLLAGILSHSEFSEECTNCGDISNRSTEILDDSSGVQGNLKNLSNECLNETKKRDKKAEFYRYCFRVVTSVAATIAIIFGLPHMEVKTKVEVLSRQEVLKESISREEVLHDTKMFSEIFYFENR